MEWTPITTRLQIALFTAILCVQDIWLAARWGNDCTISKQMQWIAHEWPIVMVFWGGLGAHFFVPKYDAWPGSWVCAKPVCCLAAGFIAFLIAWQQTAPNK